MYLIMKVNSLILALFILLVMLRYGAASAETSQQETQQLRFFNSFYNQQKSLLVY